MKNSTSKLNWKALGVVLAIGICLTISLGIMLSHNNLKESYAQVDTTTTTTVPPDDAITMFMDKMKAIETGPHVILNNQPGYSLTDDVAPTKYRDASGVWRKANDAADYLQKYLGITYNPATYTQDTIGQQYFSSLPIDKAAPSAPTGLSLTVISPTQINLRWNAALDLPGDSGVSGYRIFRKVGTQALSQIAATTSTSYSNTGLAAATTYTYTVAASDNAGNVSAQSAPVSATTTASTTTTTTKPATTTTTTRPATTTTTTRPPY